MDIYQSHTQKKYVRAAIWLLRKKLGKSAGANVIHEDLQNCGNAGVQLLVGMLNTAADSIKEGYQSNTVRQLSELALWITYKDTGYRDVFFWLMYQCGNKQIREAIKPYVKEPKDWYVNAWVDSRENTKRLRDEGKIGKHDMSHDEQIFTPVLQAQRLKKYGKRRR